MLRKGELVADITLTDHDGRNHRLWDYRQKSHVAVLYIPDASDEQLRPHRAAIAERRRTWEWLHLTVLVLTQPHDGFFSGLHLIDRYGKFVTSFPASAEAWSDVEKELIYYEARHC